MKANTQKIILLSVLFFSDLLVTVGHVVTVTKSEFNVLKLVLRLLTDLSAQTVLIFPQNQQIFPLLIFLLWP